MLDTLTKKSSALRAKQAEGREAAAPGRSHIPSLDGLRGVAILLILLCHFYRKPWFQEHSSLGLATARMASFGRYGVELFFVLSGFLITGILLDTQEEPKALGKFYARRFLRIFPLYYGALAGVLWIVPHLVELDGGGQRILASQAWLWSYLMNLPMVDSVWDDSNVFMLGHFWSLCVEEHFYVLWPLCVFFLPRRSVGGLCGVIVLLAFVSRLAVATLGFGPTSIWNWTSFQRIDGLAIGAFIAIALRTPQFREFLPKDFVFRWIFRILGGLSLLVLALPKKWNLPTVGVFSESIVSLFFGSLLLLVLRAQPGDRRQKVFTLGFLVAMGKYSYGIYVIHGILRPWFAKTFDFVALSHGSVPPLVCLSGYYIVTIGLSFFLAYVSFHLYEKRWLALKRYFEYDRGVRVLPVPPQNETLISIGPRPPSADLL